MYSKESDGEKGTLKQLQTAINRTNIPTKVKNDPMAVEDFIDLTLDAHIVAAAMEFFGMTDVTSTPTTNIDINKIRELPKGEKKKALFIVVQRFLDHYTLHRKADQLATVESLSKEPAKKSKEGDKSKTGEKEMKKGRVN